MHHHRRWIAVAAVAAAAVIPMVPATKGHSADAALTQPRFEGLPSADREKLSLVVETAAPAEATEEAVSSAVRTRASLGLRSDRDFVVDLLTDPQRSGAVRSSGGDFAGLTVTVDEADELAIRNLLQNEMHALNSWLLRNEPTFIESRISSDDNGVVGATVLFDGPIDESIWKEGLALIAPEVRDRIAPAIAPVRRGVLDARAAQVIAVSRERGIRAGLSIEYFDGRLVINVPDVKEFDRLVAVVGDELLGLEVAGGTSGPAADKNQPQPYGLVHSSLALSQGSGLCTSGFAMSSGYGPVLLTAGHCFALGTNVYQGGSTVGTVAARNHPVTSGTNGNFDAETISTSATGRPIWGRIHINTIDWAHRITGWIGTDSDTLGDVDCQEGVTSSGMTGFGGPNCGVVLAKNFLPWWLAYANPVYRRIDTISQPGDSGGGIYWDTAYGSLAVGLVQGWLDTGGNIDLIASHLPYVQNAWGLTPLTS